LQGKNDAVGCPPHVATATVSSPRYSRAVGEELDCGGQNIRHNPWLATARRGREWRGSKKPHNYSTTPPPWLSPEREDSGRAGRFRRQSRTPFSEKVGSSNWSLIGPENTGC
jgi:hypothetical protein